MLLDEIFRHFRQRKIIKMVPKNSLVYDFGCGKNFYFLKKVSRKINYGWGFDKDASRH